MLVLAACVCVHACMCVFENFSQILSLVHGFNFCLNDFLHLGSSLIDTFRRLSSSVLGWCQITYVGNTELLWH